MLLESYVALHVSCSHMESDARAGIKYTWRVFGKSHIAPIGYDETMARHRSATKAKKRINAKPFTFIAFSINWLNPVVTK